MDGLPWNYCVRVYIVLLSPVFPSLEYFHSHASLIRLGLRDCLFQFFYSHSSFVHRLICLFIALQITRLIFLHFSFSYQIRSTRVNSVLWSSMFCVENFMQIGWEKWKNLTGNTMQSFYTPSCVEDDGSQGRRNGGQPNELLSSPTFIEEKLWLWFFQQILKIRIEMMEEEMQIP